MNMGVEPIPRMLHIRALPQSWIIDYPPRPHCGIRRTPCGFPHARRAREDSRALPADSVFVTNAARCAALLYFICAQHSKDGLSGTT